MKRLLRILKRLIFRTKPKIIELNMNSAFSHFLEMSQKGDIKAITFTEGKSTITLVDNRKFYFDPLTENASKLFSIPIIGTFEKKESEFLKKLIKSGDTCLDVGANFGYYSTLMSQSVGPRGKVFAFEPLPHTLEILKNNIILNEIENILVNSNALDETAGEKTLYLADIGISGSFKLHKYSKSFKEFTCTSITLDSFVIKNAIKSIDFIKADIEGAELAMIKGAKNTIITHQPILQLEIQESSTKLFNYTTNEIFEYILELGYSAFFVKGNKLVEIKTYNDLPDYNFFFIPHSKITTYTTLFG